MSRKFAHFTIEQATRPQAETLLRHHYLSKQTTSFRFSSDSFVATYCGMPVALAIYTGFPVPELFKGIWGVRDFRSFDQTGFLELSRVVVHPDFQVPHMTSWFVAKTLKEMRRRKAKVILSYADSDYHNGTIYAALGFDYFGLSDLKKDPWIPMPEEEGGKYLPPEKRPGRSETHWKKVTRGGWAVARENGGIYVDRGRKHRFLKIFDREVKKWPILWPKQKWTA